MNLMEHLQPHVVIPLKIGNIDISITNAVISMWVACVLVFLTLTLAGRIGRLIPRGLQNLMESLVNFVKQSLIHEILGEEGMSWFPFIATLFFFILFCNLLGLIPKMFTATSNINVTASLAAVVFICTQGAGIAKHGLMGYGKTFIPKGMPRGVMGKILIGFMIIVEMISQLARPFSLAVRLFANMTAGHMVILVFLSMIFMFQGVFAKIFVTPMSVVMAVVMMAFEIFVSLLQAFIFAILASIYISLAVHPEH
ncbi:MAG: F0F1 ATP synthase subunit A [Desulfobacterales bacterium]|jgi:F-type H+-transporting ATPase subunit a|nr:F0F1 ATP synthase subunit A [Desulfobacterales bacterium]